MILVDTSAWIEFFRGDGELADRVDQLLDVNEVALCGPVVTELRRGLRGRAERQRVLPLLEGCHYLEPPARLWEDAGDLGYLLARRGVTAKTLDLLIASHALSYDVPLLERDADYRRIEAAGVGLRLDHS